MERIEQLTERELLRFQEQTPNSLALARRAIEVMPLAVPTNVCALDPYPIAVSRGSGAYLKDIDQNRYVDYHNGFGVNVVGHANPDITEAVQEAMLRGSHYGATTEDICLLAEEICNRWGLNWVRFSHSGTEATMDAIRLARAYSGKTRVAKIEGGYHGSHEVALVSPNLSLDGSEGDDLHPASRPFGKGVPPRVLEEVSVLPFNNLAAAEELLSSGQFAALITEPILFNVGAIFPEPGYLQGLRDLCDRYDVFLIFDETKTAATVAWGGAEELFGVAPHIKTLGKAIAGGLPMAALGGVDGRLYDLIEDGSAPHLGTFCGNPVSAASALATLSLLDRDAYHSLDSHGKKLKELLDKVIDDYQLPAYVVQAGAKGSLVWAERPELRDFRDYRRRFQFSLGFLAWLYLKNRGVFLAPGQDEQWTHSIYHGDKEAEKFAAIIEEMAADLAG